MLSCARTYKHRSAQMDFFYNMYQDEGKFENLIRRKMSAKPEFSNLFITRLTWRSKIAKNMLCAGRLDFGKWKLLSGITGFIAAWKFD